jgi:hypothetical protein
MVRGSDVANGRHSEDASTKPSGEHANGGQTNSQPVDRAGV